ncbi:uncharacterized protein LOC116307060 [Actinia tenebrosa]|uniref:Uncharacterized protein LOC116307060 n=1 Tax=Actinia tenebrosa TaxID=6105 RepID=A0A6P8IZS5_ACTTE|nr:uncharacterized protein LOC116307060 [Actinia tenebrosa]
MHIKGRCIQRRCVLLAILVMGQQFNFVFANQVLDLKEGMRKRTGKLNDDWELFEQEPNHKYKRLNQDLESKNQKSLNSGKEIVKESKRGIHAVLFGASIATSLINLGLDIILKVKGCCVFYKSICRDTKEYNGRSRALARQMNAINLEWRRVRLLRDWIKASNDKNAEIWIEVKRIGDLQDQIVKTLDPGIIKEFNIKVDNIRKQVKAGNQSVINMSYQEFDNLFQSSFTTVGDTALRLAGITGLIGTKIAAFGFKHYKLAKITKTLRTSYGSKLLKAGPGAKKFFGFSKAGMNMHLKQTSRSMYKATFTGSRAARFMKGAGSVMSVVSIAMDIYSIIKKIRACKKVRDRARNGVREVRLAQARAGVLASQLHSYKIQLNNRGVIFIKKQLASQDLHTILASIRDLCLGASKQSSDLRSAAPAISKFLARIKRASNAEITILQKQLVSALKKVTIFLDCYLNKLKMEKYVQKYCELGSDSIGNLYNRANGLFDFNSVSCRTKDGFPYTDLNNVKERIAAKAKEKGFLTDCVLNSKAKKQKACELNGDGFNPKQIASKMSLQEYQVNHFLKTCPEQPITPSILTQICTYRQFCAPESRIASLTRISQARLLNIPCPCPELLN